jgi:hypothetical protein
MSQLVLQLVVRDYILLWKKGRGKAVFPISFGKKLSCKTCAIVI